MSTIILEKPADCETTVTTVHNVSVPTQFIFSGENAVNAMIEYEGSMLDTINSVRPTFNANAAGDYTITIAGVCKRASVCVAELLYVP